MKKVKKKVAVGLSGGVDSSVAAYLLKEKGHDVTGVHIQCWGSKADGCVADGDRADALRVAATLNVPFEFLNFVDKYKEKVISYFYDEYRVGRTPNPDVVCNKDIKFGLFLEWAMKKGFDHVATGHYARIEPDVNEGSLNLLKGFDKSKDQSYFLYILDQEVLSEVIFPVGGMLKGDVRDLAKKVGLHTYSKPDSTGICFIGEVDIREFLMKEITPERGDVVSLDGEVVGKHDGVWFYTIGQRHGFEVTKYRGVPLYVVDKNVVENELIVGEKKDVYSNSFSILGVHWVNREPEIPFSCEVRIRHLGDLHKARVCVEGNMLNVKLKRPVFGVAPGQSAVFYDSDKVLGGGIIEKQF